MWSPAQVAPFSGVNSDQDPAFSPDGQRLFFASNRPQNGSGPDELGYRIFYVERETGGWGSAKSVGEAINQGLTQFAPSVAEDGTLYFTADYPDGMGLWDIYRSRLVNGAYQPPENLGAPINTEEYEFNPFIAPDQSYIIYNYDTLSVSMSWQQADGTWANTKMLNFRWGINPPIWDVTVSPDGKVIFISTDGLMPELPSMPPGFDSITEEIGEAQKIKSLDRIPDVQGPFKLDIYWLSGEVLKGLED